MGDFPLFCGKRFLSECFCFTLLCTLAFVERDLFLLISYYFLFQSQIPLLVGFSFS